MTDLLIPGLTRLVVLPRLCGAAVRSCAWKRRCSLCVNEWTPSSPGAAASNDLLVHDMEIELALTKLDIPRVRRQKRATVTLGEQQRRFYSHRTIKSLY